MQRYEADIFPSLIIPQFWKKRDSRNCLLKMNGLWNLNSWFYRFGKVIYTKYSILFNTRTTSTYHNFERNENHATVFLKWTDFKGALLLHLSTVYFSHLSYIPDQLRKCIHISKPLTVIRSCCWWSKQIIILSVVKQFFFIFFSLLLHFKL